ncbi:hypothetical protein BDY21DRAFT_371295 [Lineolata rhizophorae]|uniref:Uncharacterized protein n=1 Tax=Lineolata rhizophorae TaxID=578093 RepID=A0A6A6P109_9PEZI|nr:hypothetical protein BDY21DRAFT_371295 [Lineolata rhizophorae]
MSRNASTYSSSFSTSFTASSSTVSDSSSSSPHTASAGRAHKITTRSDPAGTVRQVTTQTLGEPALQETRAYDASGREIPVGAAGNRLPESDGQRFESARIEDVGDEEGDEAGREYRARMEDEYAKREGGA